MSLNFLGCGALSGTKIASQNRSDHGGRKRARNHSAAEIAGFFASPAAKKSLAASDFGVNLKIAGSSQRPWPQVAAAARFCGRSDHGTLSVGLLPAHNPNSQEITEKKCHFAQMHARVPFTGCARNRTGTGNRNRRNRFARNPKNLSLGYVLGDNLQNSSEC